MPNSSPSGIATVWGTPWFLLYGPTSLSTHGWHAASSLSICPGQNLLVGYISLNPLPIHSCPTISLWTWWLEVSFWLANSPCFTVPPFLVVHSPIMPHLWSLLVTKHPSLCGWYLHVSWLVFLRLRYSLVIQRTSSYGKSLSFRGKPSYQWAIVHSYVKSSEGIICLIHSSSIHHHPFVIHDPSSIKSMEVSWVIGLPLFSSISRWDSPSSNIQLWGYPH